MILGIDASNIRAGGGLTHLVELLRCSEAVPGDFGKIIVWGTVQTLRALPERNWLELVEVRQLDMSRASRMYWQWITLPRLAAQKCDVLFVPGGSFSSHTIPVVTMSQNLLPFEMKEALRYGVSWVLLRILILRLVQGRSFRKADGVIFLTDYARKTVSNVVGSLRGQQAIIPHGINGRFFSHPKPQLNIDCYSVEKPFRLLYISIVDLYKHQWQVVEAVARLRTAGLPVELHLVGPFYPAAHRKLKRALKQSDCEGAFIHYHGPVPYQELNKFTNLADSAIFASTCENLPIILLEAMASGVPIACSSYGPMPEVLRGAGVYFDPENVDSLYQALAKLLGDAALREKLASLAHDYAREFSWGRCAGDTLKFLHDVGARRSTEVSTRSGSR